MNKPFRPHLFLCLLLMLPVIAPVQAETKLSLESAINKAGEQRMLSQRIVVKYAQLGQDLFAKDAQAKINWDIALFETQLEELKKYSDDEVIQEALEWVTIAWERFRTLAAGEVRQDKLRRLNHLSEDLLYSSNKVALILQDLKNKPLHRLVNIAGGQRMLSQRLAKYYLLRSWGFESLSTHDRQSKTVREFETALETLRTAPETSNDIREQLEKAIIQWTWFKSVLSRDIDQGDYRLIVVDASNELLEILEDITKKYELAATATR
jgi:nitrate/nitrite-specific signal transduction histidine kinase